MLERLRTEPVLAAGLAVFAVMALAQIAIPLTPVGERAGLSTLVVVALAAATALFTARAWGTRRTLVAGVAVVAVAFAVEVVGSRTGVPFGRYRYTTELSPRPLGVPAIVPLAWFAMGVPAVAAAAAIARTTAARVALGGAALSAWDLFLDPQMVKERYWVWPGGGVYRGIPASNFLGWLLAAAAVAAILLACRPRRTGDEAWLVGTYTWMAVLETVGFVVFFADALVGVVGGLAMLPIAALAWVRRSRA